MRVCHLGKYYPPAPGGIETHLQTLARAQFTLGWATTVLCMNHGHAPATLDDNGVEVKRFKAAATLGGLHVCPELVRALKVQDSRADIFHLHVPNPVMLLHAAWARIRKPLVVTYHSDIIRQRIRAALFRPVEKTVYRRVSRIMMTSPNYANGSTFLHAFKDRLVTVPMGLNLQAHFQPSPEHVKAAGQLRQKYPGPLWLTTGRLIYYKGFITAIRALPKVPGTLLMLGSGPDEDLLRAEVRALKLEQRVVFVGSVPSHLDIIPYYLACEALWFPSNARSEAFGLVQVEAMACGCPVINTDIPDSGVAWVSPHDLTGLTVPMNDPDALAAAALRLLNEPGLRERLGNAGRERARTEFDHMTMARRCIEIYTQVLEAKPCLRRALIS